jgi:CubicO group peptidase (beta-lactamase class C family)
MRASMSVAISPPGARSPIRLKPVRYSALMSRHSLLLFVVAALLSACSGSTVPAARSAPSAVNQGASVSAPRTAAASSGPAQSYASIEPGYIFDDPDRKKKLTSGLADIDAAVAREMSVQGIPGVAVGVVIDGELVYAKGFGYADLEKKTKVDEDTVFRIGSISKSFIGLAALSLRDDGVIALDDPLVKYVPDAASLVYPTRDSPPITLRQLLTHTSGMGRDNYVIPLNGSTEADILRSLHGLPVDIPPGVEHAYSNFGFTLVGLALAQAAHSSVHDLVNRRVLAPYGMKATTWEAKNVPRDRLATGYWSGKDPRGRTKETRRAPQFDLGADDPSGGLFSSVRDMARYVAAQLAAYPPRSTPEEGLIRRSTLREAHANGVPSDLVVSMAEAPRKGESLVNAVSESYGYGWVARRTCGYDDMVLHGGVLPGYSADIRFLKERGVGVITLTNHTPTKPGDISGVVLRALARTGGLSKCIIPPSALFDRIIDKFLDVENSWDEATYKSLVTAGRPDITDLEYAEFSSYRDVNGWCKAFKVIEVQSPLDVTYAFTCERGTLEMRIVLSPRDGRILGFWGWSRHQPVPDEVRPLAEKVTQLIRKWDGAIYQRHFMKARRSLEQAKAEFDSLRSLHGTCIVKDSTAYAFGRPLNLECERGGDLDLQIEHEPSDANQAVRYTLSAKEGVCSMR